MDDQKDDKSPETAAALIQKRVLENFAKYTSADALSAEVSRLVAQVVQKTVEQAFRSIGLAVQFHGAYDPSLWELSGYDMYTKLTESIRDMASEKILSAARNLVSEDKLQLSQKDIEKIEKKALAAYKYRFAEVVVKLAEQQAETAATCAVSTALSTLEQLPAKTLATQIDKIEQEAYSRSRW